MPDPSVSPVPVPAAGGRVVEVDVRDDLRNGREPFQRIMGAVAALQPADVLHLRATFEPVPLFRVLGRRGFAHVAREVGPDDWSVWFHRPGAASAIGGAPAGSAPAAAPCAAPSAAGEVVLDVRGLEPPEPMVRTLAALESLPAGGVLVQHNERVPQFLLPILTERGFHYLVDDAVPDRVVVRIRRAP